MNYKKRATNIIQKKFKTNVLSISVPEPGQYNEVLIAHTDKDEYVIRFTTEDFHSLKAHAYALGKWAKLGVPVPKILLQGKDYVVETKIPGNDWRKTKLNPKQTAAALEKLGLLLKKMHSVKTRRYGYIIKPGIGQYNSYKEFMEIYLKLRFDKIKKIRFVSSERLKKISTYLDKNMDLLNLKSPRLCHKDVNKGNIMIDNGKISGIIDASDAISGDPAFDTGIIYQRFGDEMFKHFVKKYGKVDMRKVKYYAIINALRKIPLDHHKGNLEACERHLQQIERIIG